MSAPPLDPPAPLPPLAPLERHGQIEVDAFCIGCFYNLHGQVVTIDPRLGFPVCRCPECGRFQPAGAGLTSASVWMRRLASILLFIWVLIVGGITIAIDLCFMGISTAAVGLFAQGHMILIAPKQWRYQYSLLPWNVPSTSDIVGRSTMLWISSGSAFLGFIAGMLCVTLLWHWNRARYFWVMILPLVSAFILVVLYYSIPEWNEIRSQCSTRVYCQTAIQCIGIGMGIRWGRSLSRAIVQMFIPPKPRQFLAFLWLIDGKKPG